MRTASGTYYNVQDNASSLHPVLVLLCCMMRNAVVEEYVVL